ILVGAPLGQNPQPNTTQSGTLKRCPVTQNQFDCEDVLTDGRLNPAGRYEPEDNEKLFPPLPIEIKEGQWLGVTVSSQRPSGVILVCAHRYISKAGNTPESAQHGLGLCYILDNDFSYSDVFEPCKGRKTEKLHEEYGFCQAGTSGTLLDDGTVVLGAPGVYTWRGSLYLKNVAGSYLKRDKNIYYTPHEGNNPPIDKYSYLGMSVTGGKYFDDTFTYVGGAPRSENHGQVIFFEKLKQINPMRVIQKLDGEQFASGFGYQLVTADVNGDTFPDLLVSAPFYFGKHEGGAVYIYLNDDQKINKKFDLKLTGKLESRYGLAVANMGDINKDEAEDIAISAPYEDEGVVYIHLGSKDGLSKLPSQIIKASELGLKPNQKINTFGSSLSGGLDIDGNGYPDLVIGAYNSSASVALLSRSIISLQTTVPKKGDIKAIDPAVKGCAVDVFSNFSCFSFKTCCSIDPLPDTEKQQTLNIIYTIEAETFQNQKKFSRVFFGPDTDSRSNIMKRNFEIESNGIEQCFVEVVYIKDSAGNDIQTPIKFHLNYTMVENPLKSSGLVELNPILDQNQAERIFEASFQKDCGNDDVCESQLEVIATLGGLRMGDDGQYDFVLGKSDDIQLNVNVTNLADSAYETNLYVVHQSSVTYIAASKESTVVCSRHNDTVVLCNFGNPLKRGNSAKTVIRFDPIGLEDSEPQVKFIVFANTTSKQIEPKSPIILKTNVVKQAELRIIGYETRPPQAFYGGEVKGESAMKYLDDIGNSILHTYDIVNEGPWRAPYVEVDIDWPHQVGNDKPLGKWLLYLEEMPIVESSTGGECEIEDRFINPLKLEKKLQAENLMTAEMIDTSLSGKRLNKSHSYIEYRDKSSFSSQEKKTVYEESSLNRVKRDRAMIIRAEKLTDSDGKSTNTVTMDCRKKTAKCIKIKCRLYNIQRKGRALIKIKSRVWNSTLTMDYPRVDYVTIVSTAKLRIPPMYGINQNESDDSSSISLKAYPELRDQAPSGEIPLWVIILGIIVGLCLLALVAFILWKCGFFKRRRPDPTLSGNLEKNSESRPFINK
ncbi:CLUMA_CG009900, isoform A, partial [Clunio marinus]